MSNLTLSSTLPVVAGVTVTTDGKGRFNLNALHKASGLGEHKKPSEWLRLKNTKELIESLTNNQSGDSRSAQEVVKVNNGGINQGTFAHELLAVSYAGWISPAFQLQVNQVFIDYKTGNIKEKKDQTGLLQFRKARAIKMATDSAKDICSVFPSLSQDAKQVIYANLVNPIAGNNVIPLPTLEYKLYEAGEIGNMLNISANKVGRIANSLGIKTEEYGKTVLGQSQYSSKQVPMFLYNEKGIEAIKNALAETTH